ncbi:MAG: acetyltransferase [Flavobacteriales bacterium]
MKTLAILGAGHLGQQIAHFAISDQQYSHVVFFDDFSKEKKIKDWDIIGTSSDIVGSYKNNLFQELILGIGYNYLDTKQRLFDQFYGVIPFGRIIHSSCIIDPTAKINEGTVLYPGVIVDANVKIESNVLVNLGCCIAHDSTIGHSSFLSPRVAIAGFVKIGQRCILGINSSFKDNIELSNEIQIGAGTVVVKSLKEKDIYIGVPARKIR